MKNVILNKESLLVRYYMWAYNIDDDMQLPYNFCLFFWNLALAIVLSPLIWLSYPISLDHYESIGRRVTVSLLILLCLVSVGLLIAILILRFGIIWGILLLIGSIVAAIVSLLLLGVLLEFIENLVTCNFCIPDTTIFKVIKAKKDSFIYKYCPKIEWK